MDSVNRRLMLAGAGLAGAAVLSRLAKAGDITPPPGPIGPTGKTTQEIYDRVARGGPAATSEARTCVQTLSGTATAQYVIDQPGCYYLAGNIPGVPGKCCIEIRCSHVELECDAFTFIGGQGTQECIRMASATSPPTPLRCVGIYDAGFQNWQGQCIKGEVCDDGNVEECVFDSCVSQPTASGPGVCCALGRGGVIYDCDSRECIGGAIVVGENGVIEECASTGARGVSGGLGALVGGPNSTVEDNFVIDCDGPAIVVGSRGVALYNRVARCADGIVLADACVCEDNDIDLAPGAGGHGITVTGQRCCVCCNSITGGGLVVLIGGDGTLIEDNLMVGPGAPGGTTGSGGGVLFIQQGVTRCHVACNRARATSVATAMVIPAGNSYGPIALCSDGDISLIPEARHPWANFVY